MFLQLAHTRLHAFTQTRQLTLECYRVSKRFPDDERFNMTSQLRRAALSVHLYIAEGCSRKPAPERKRFFEISRGSLIEIDTILDLASALGYCKQETFTDTGEYIVNASNC